MSGEENAHPDPARHSRPHDPPHPCHHGRAACLWHRQQAAAGLRGRLEPHGWTRGSWGKTENNREAKYYTITKAGLKALDEETERWRQMAGVVEKLLAEEQ